MKLLPIVAFAAFSTQLSASPICSFDCLTLSDSNLALCTPIAPQFSFDVLDLGSGIVGFQFSNSGPASVLMTNVYFSDPLDLVTGFVSEPWSDTGVSFASGGPDILASIAAAFGFNQEYKAQAVAGATLGPNETVTIQMALAGVNTADTVRQGIINDQFRVVVATQGIGGPDRTVYLEAQCCDVPEPASVALMGLGLAGVVLRSRFSRVRSRG